MTKLHELCERFGQSPWLDNLTRQLLTSGGLRRLVDDGIRGVTSNPTIFERAISKSSDYDDQFRRLLAEHTVEDAYWGMVVEDVEDALELLRPLYDEVGGADGFVSLEVAPSLAFDTEGTVKAARYLHDRVAAPNLLVKVPATPEGVPAIRELTGEGRSINVTLIFSLERYDEVIEAYLSGLEACEGDLSCVHSVASFFVSRVDTEVDRRLEAIGTDEALALRGRAAIAQAKLAYELFCRRFSGPRWEALQARGAHCQRPLWASTSTKNPAYPDLLYVENLVGPLTVDTMPDKTVEAVLDHARLERTVDRDVDEARETLERLAALGVAMEDVAGTLEAEGVAAFAKSYDELMQSLRDKANEIT